MAVNDISGPLMALKYSGAVEVIDEVTASNPDASVADVREYVVERLRVAQAMVAEEEATIQRGVCRHCGVKIVLGNDDAWYHGDIPSWGARGCRSYSFDRERGWDDTLNSGWKATPR
jgi:hypothetical protein